MKPESPNGRRGSAQWIGAVVLLAVMVFVITFAVNYLGANRKPKKTAEETVSASELTFPVRGFPGTGMPLEQEYAKPGSHDFWFINENDKPVKVGLDRKSCKCSSVQLFTVPAEEKTRTLEALRKPASASASTSTDNLLGFASTHNDKVPQGLKFREESLSAEQSAEVPAGAVGWVRLRWSGETAGGQILSARVWMDHRDGPVAAFEVQVNFLQPLLTGKDHDLGTFRARDLPGQADFLVWSATRPKFSIKAQLSGVRRPESDPFVVGEPVALTRKELAEIKDGPPALAGYRIPLELRAVSKDGTTPFELGSFRRWVSVTSPDEGTNPLEVTVTGRVEGDVTVGTGDDSGHVVLGTFDRRRGASQTVTLESSVPGLELEVDGKRMPDFLKATFTERPAADATGPRTWRLKVEAVRDRASGPFPRADDPYYRDSAVYIKTKEKSPRTIRIPVAGTAY